MAALHLVADVLEAAFERHGLPKKLRRRGTEKDMPEAHVHVVDLCTPNEVDTYRHGGILQFVLRQMTA